MAYGIVYCAKNICNDKIYIGQTTQTLKKRKNEHLSSLKKYYFSNAIKKYGKDAFEWTILFEAQNKSSLDSAEIHFIETFDTINKGYNLKTGGANSKPSAKTKRLMSKAQKQLTESGLRKYVNSNKNGKLTLEEVKEMRENHKNRKRGEKSWKKYNISKSLYYKIIAKTIWR